MKRIKKFSTTQKHKMYRLMRYTIQGDMYPYIVHILTNLRWIYDDEPLGKETLDIKNDRLINLHLIHSFIYCLNHRSSVQDVHNKIFVDKWLPSFRYDKIDYSFAVLIKEIKKIGKDRLTTDNYFEFVHALNWIYEYDQFYKYSIRVVHGNGDLRYPSYWEDKKI